jgi:hypothetical protein
LTSATGHQLRRPPRPLAPELELDELEASTGGTQATPTAVALAAADLELDLSRPPAASKNALDAYG